jgi:CHRD domain
MFTAAADAAQRMLLSSPSLPLPRGAHMRALHAGSSAAGLAVLTLGLCAGTVSVAVADDDRRGKDRKVSARLSGFNEVHFIAGSAGPPVVSPALRGAVSTGARGNFKAELKGDEIEYTLSYKGLEGAVTQAHIHFGQRHTVGGIVVWLCQTQGVPAPSAPIDVSTVTPLCPGTTEGVVSGTITPAQVLAVAGQGFELAQSPSERFDRLVKAIRAGATYANVHSMLFPPGEIRGKVGDRKRGDHDH